MKHPLLKIIFFIGLFFLSVSCGNTERNYFPNGHLKSEIHYKFGKEDGISTFYNEEYNTKELEVEMKNGKKEGKCIRYFFNGNNESVAYYKNDLLDGIERLYDIDGNLIMETHYVKGKKEGAYSYWFENDLIREKGFFKNDKFDGKWEYYDMRGCFIGEATFSEGNGKLISYDENGNLSRISPYLNNKKNGTEIYFSPSGDTTKTILYKDDRIAAINGKTITSAE